MSEPNEYITNDPQSEVYDDLSQRELKRGMRKRRSPRKMGTGGEKQSSLKQKEIKTKRYINNQYELLGLIGKGSSGVVYKGRNIETGEIFALKKISISALTHEQLAKLTQESEIQRGIEHPYIVKFIRCIREGRSLYLVLEYIEIGSVLKLVHKFKSLQQPSQPPLPPLPNLSSVPILSLSSLTVTLPSDAPLTPTSMSSSSSTTSTPELFLSNSEAQPITPQNRVSCLPESLICLYVHQLLLGLEYLHANSIIHRDIKGGNILLTREGNIKLADFGVAAQILSTEEKRYSVVGSAYWMAPECITMEGHTTTSDIWSLGCTIIELIMGEPPFFHLTNLPAMYKMANESPEIPDFISDEAKDFLSLCFIRNSEERPSATSLLTHPWLSLRHSSPDPKKVVEDLLLSKDYQDELKEKKIKNKDLEIRSDFEFTERTNEELESNLEDIKNEEVERDQNEIEEGEKETEFKEREEREREMREKEEREERSQREKEDGEIKENEEREMREREERKEREMKESEERERKIKEREEREKREKEETAEREMKESEERKRKIKEREEREKREREERKEREMKESEERDRIEKERETQIEINKVIIDPNEDEKEILIQQNTIQSLTDDSQQVHQDDELKQPLIDKKEKKEEKKRKKKTQKEKNNKGNKIKEKEIIEQVRNSSQDNAQGEEIRNNDQDKRCCCCCTIL